MAIQTTQVEYVHGGQSLLAEVAWDDALGARPGVLIAHTWAGRTAFEGEQARALAAQGYVGFALDMYGEGRVGQSVEENRELMMGVLADRRYLQQRMMAALEALRSLPQCDGQTAALGFCFGGLCVLDLARSGADTAGVVSLHGLLSAPPEVVAPEGGIRAKVLVLHGYDDPMVPPEDVLQFAAEMSAAGVDWQVHAYGGTQHAFTNPNANAPDMGTVYHAQSARRAFATTAQFLSELFV